MSRQRHDHLGKHLVSYALALFGPVQTNRSVPAEERSIDVVGHVLRVEPRWQRVFGLFGRMAHGWTAFEISRNPVTAAELRACEAKVANLEADLARQARRQRQPRRRRDAVHLWVTTPTLSHALRTGFRLKRRPGWPPGVLDSGGWGMVVVVIHELPVTRSTLFLRLVGRDGVQDQAFSELAALPARDPLRSFALPPVVNFIREDRRAHRPSASPKDPLMTPEAFVRNWEREVLRRGKEEGKAEGEAKGKAEGKAEGILTVLQARGLKIPARLRTRVRATSSPTQLDRLLRRAVRVDSAAELFR